MKQTWWIWFQDRLFKFPIISARSSRTNACCLTDGRPCWFHVVLRGLVLGLNSSRGSKVEGRGKEAPTPNPSSAPSVDLILQLARSRWSLREKRHCLQSNTLLTVQRLWFKVTFLQHGVSTLIKTTYSFKPGAHACLSLLELGSQCTRAHLGGLVSCKHVFRKGIHSEVVLNEHLEKMLFTGLSVRQVVRGFFRGKIIQSKCTFPHFVIGLVLPLLLPTPAIWFSLDHKRNVSDGVVSGIGTLFSLDYKLYASDYDSDSIASENQPLDR